MRADYGEIHFERSRQSRVVYSNENVESVQTFTTSSGNARCLDGGGWGFASFQGDDFAKSIEAASENARLVSRELSLQKSYFSRLNQPVIADLETRPVISPSTFSLEQKNDLARKYNDLLKHPEIVSTRVVYSDWTVEKYFVNTEGCAVRQVKTFCGVSFGAMARDGSNVQQGHESVGQYGGLELVLNLEPRIELVKKRALDLLRARKLESGNYQVLLDPNLAGVFAHEAFGHLSEADFLSENPRMQDVMTLGRKFGPEILNIVDDGTLENLAGYTPVDDEGIPGQKTYLIRDGILSGRLHSRETAARMGETPTGNARALTPFFQPIVRMTNTYIAPGTESFEELLSHMDDGIYAVDYLGGMTNLEMFTFSSGYAYRVKNGKIGELLRDVVLSGNVFNTLKHVSHIGCDITHHGGLGGCGKAGQSGLPVGTGSPHIIVNDVLVGGV